jgi:hypothetical protein
MFRRIFVLLLLLVFVFLILWVTGAIRLKSGPVRNLETLPFSSGDTYVYNNGAFLYVKDDQVIYHDIENSGSDWSVTVDTNEIKVAKSDTLCVIYNSVAMQITSATFPVEFTGTVLDVKCGKNYVAALKKDSFEQYSMQVFDSTSQQIDQLTFDDQFIVDFGFFGDSDTLWTLSLDYSGASPVSTITTYTVGSAQAITGIMTLEGQIIEQLRFTDNSIFAVGINHIIRYSYNTNKEQSKKLVYGWDVLDFAMLSRPTFLLTPRQYEDSGALSVAKILTMSEDSSADETEVLLQLPAGTIGAYLCNNKVFCVTSASMYVYSLSGQLVDSYAFASAIDSAEKLDTSHILIGRGQDLFMAQLD